MAYDGLHMDVKSLRDRGDRLFSLKASIDQRNQDIAEQFYVERADFTAALTMDGGYADHLTTSYPLMVRRDLGDSLGAMLRPPRRKWFHIRADREDREDHAAKLWMERVSETQRRAMADPKAMFARATKEGDHDFSAFGGCVISTEVNRRDTALIYRCWHLRDTAWAEDSYGQIAEIHRNWKPTAAELVAAFPKTCHENVRNILSSDPYHTVLVRHAVIRADDYGWSRSRHPWVSVFYDAENNCVLEERGSWTRIYTIPRWATVSGCQYAYSPAVTIALPDARLLQAMTLSLLDAGERAANPPMIGVEEAIRGDMDIRPGGFTAVDWKYDERLGEVLRPLYQDKSGLPFGMDMADRIGAGLKEAFYISKLNMPTVGGPEMTAYEFGQRVQEHVRQVLPLFEPMETDYNGALCEMTFETLRHEGAFGSPEDIPPSIRGTDVVFRFESPLSEAEGKAKGQIYLEASALMANSISVYPTAPRMMDFKTTLRDVMDGIGVPAKWLFPPERVAQEEAADAQRQEAAAMLGTMQQGADVAATLAPVAQAMGPM